VETATGTLMSIMLAANLIFFGQGYDDAGAASRFSIIIGALALPCLIAIAIVLQKLKDAKRSEEEVAKLNQKVAKLEQEKKEQEDQYWQEYVSELEKEPEPKPQKLELTNPHQADPEYYRYLTQPQQAYLNEILARACSWLDAGNQFTASIYGEKDQIFAAKTEIELREIFLKGANVERPKIEAEILAAYMLVKQAEFEHKKLKK
jgi:hypothetical protein